MKIYTVVGWAGEYSDRTDWPVRSFSDEARAKQEVEKLTIEARLCIIKRNELWDSDSPTWIDPQSIMPPNDPGYTSYNYYPDKGYGYYIMETDLIE